MKKVLLDENLPKQLKKYFSAEFDFTSVPDLGWQSKKNGELLCSMDESEIEFLLTADKSLRYQQNLEKFKVRVAVLFSNNIRLKNLILKVSEIEAKIKTADAAEKIVEIDIRDKMAG